jgi:hypothetical protein
MAVLDYHLVLLEQQLSAVAVVVDLDGAHLIIPALVETVAAEMVVKCGQVEHTQLLQLEQLILVAAEVVNLK